MLLVALLGASACAGAKPPPPTPGPKPEATAEAGPATPPKPEPLDAGKECVKATAECGGGVCLAKIKNDCPEPVTCELKSMATCSGETSSGEARGNARGTVPAKGESELSASESCEGGGQIQLTVAESLSCN